MPYEGQTAVHPCKGRQCERVGFPCNSLLQSSSIENCVAALGSLLTLPTTREKCSFAYLTCDDPAERARRSWSFIPCISIMQLFTLLEKSTAVVVSHSIVTRALATQWKVWYFVFW